MTEKLSSFAARLRESIASGFDANAFGALALELFALQFAHNPAYRKLCEARRVTPQTVEHWTRIPAVPTAAFKELELTSLAPADRTAVFHSSGTTEQKPSRHFHNAESLALYEASLWAWFAQNFQLSTFNFQLCVLTPPPEDAPNSSLVHMFETIRQKSNAPKNIFVGKISTDGAWALDFEAIRLMLVNPPSAFRHPPLILGTAFSFVHLLDFLAEKNLRLALPPGSRVLETGGYKNRSRSLPKSELHALITEFLGVPRENIICEYGMSELSSQAYNGVRPSSGAAMFDMQAASSFQGCPGSSPLLRPRRAHSGANTFRFPPWARAQIISPETGREVADGETGLIRVFDLANVFSVAAIQTEDLAVRRGDGFELLGRAQLAEPRGCSLMTA